MKKEEECSSYLYEVNKAEILLSGCLLGYVSTQDVYYFEVKIRPGRLYGTGRLLNLGNFPPRTIIRARTTIRNSRVTILVRIQSRFRPSRFNSFKLLATECRSYTNAIFFTGASFPFPLTPLTSQDRSW